jgi:hypothetical protein
MALDAPHIEFVVRETPDKIAIFGEHDYRFDLPKSKITFVGRNVWEWIGTNCSSIKWIKILRRENLSTQLRRKRMMYSTGCIPTEGSYRLVENYSAITKIPSV